MSADKYSSVFSRQMHIEGNVFLFVCPSLLVWLVSGSYWIRQFHDILDNQGIDKWYPLSLSPLITGYQPWVSWITQSNNVCSLIKSILLSYVTMLTEKIALLTKRSERSKFYLISSFLVRLVGISGKVTLVTKRSVRRKFYLITSFFLKLVGISCTLI